MACASDCSTDGQHGCTGCGRRRAPGTDSRVPVVDSAPALSLETQAQWQRYQVARELRLARARAHPVRLVAGSDDAGVCPMARGAL